MSRTRLTRTAMGLAWGIVVALGVAVTPVAAPSAPAAVPPAPFGEFFAPECVGDTAYDPRDRTTATTPGAGSAVVPNLTRVWGPRLDAFNAGGVVVLYDAYGTNSGLGAYPAVCGVRYDPSAPGGTLAEWMFCTDYFSKVCAATDVDGYLHTDLADPVIPQPSAQPGNPKLSPDHERLIAYLIRHGAPFLGNAAVPGFGAGGVTEARVDGSTDQRVALQLLVWCVSDWPDPPSALPEHLASETNRLQMCENSMNAAEQSRLLALIPVLPVMELNLLQPALSSARPGETLQFELETNVFHLPITLTATGGATLAVIDPASGAVLSGSSLVVDGVDGSASKVIALALTTTTAGRVDVAASVAPLSTESLSWNQADAQCQVFATFTASALPQVDDLMTLAFAAETDLPRTGPAELVMAVAGAVALLLGGGLLLGGTWGIRPRGATPPTARP